MEYLIFVVILVINNVAIFQFVSLRYKSTVGKELQEFEDNRKRSWNGYYIPQDRDEVKPTKPGTYRPWVMHGEPRELGEYIFDDRENAELVLDTLKERADRYGVVSVADFCELIDANSSINSMIYGWDRKVFSEARINTVRHGLYVIKFPPVQEL